MKCARPICLRLLAHWIACPFILALASAGKSRPARIAMMAMTTSSSISVKARRFERQDFITLLWAGSKHCLKMPPSQPQNVMRRDVGRILTGPPSVLAPELVPVAVGAGFFQGPHISESSRRPELPRMLVPHL